MASDLENDYPQMTEFSFLPLPLLNITSQNPVSKGMGCRQETGFPGWVLLMTRHFFEFQVILAKGLTLSQ